jgi:sec-independent protein translocase protein TatA
VKPWHIVVLIIVLILVFGAGTLPDIARSIGQSLKVFKKEVSELREDGPTGAAGTAAPPPVSPSTSASASPAAEPPPSAAASPPVGEPGGSTPTT